MDEKVQEGILGTQEVPDFISLTLNAYSEGRIIPLPGSITVSG